MTAADRRRLRRARMAALGIAPPLGTPRAPVSALEVTRHVGALQAQDYQSGMWSIGVRSGLTLEAVEQAVLDRQVVRTWPMRGTLHLVPAEDARWMCRLLALRLETALRTRFAQLGITLEDLATSERVVREHLGVPMSRPALWGLLAAHGVDPSGQRGYHLVGHHCMTGLLCQGPLEGKQPTFVLLDAWVPVSLDPSREEGMARLVERYVRSHGPVTERDIAGWLNHTLAFVREALALLGDRLVREELDGTVWISHVDAPAAGRPVGVQLLPQWDELLLGYTSRHISLPPVHVERVVPGRNLQFQPTLVVDGEVAGTWRRRPRGEGTVVEVDTFRPLSTTGRAALDRAAAAYGRFLGQPVEALDVARRGP